MQVITRNVARWLDSCSTYLPLRVPHAKMVTGEAEINVVVTGGTVRLPIHHPPTPAPR